MANKYIKQTKNRLDKCYEDSAVSVSTVKYPLIELRWGRISSIDAECSRPTIKVAMT